MHQLDIPTKYLTSIIFDINRHQVNQLNSAEIHNLVLTGHVQQGPRPLVQHVGLYRAVAQQHHHALEMLPAFGQRCKPFG